MKNFKYMSIDSNGEYSDREGCPKCGYWQCPGTCRG